MAKKSNRLKSEKNEEPAEAKGSRSFLSRFESVKDFLQNEKIHQVSGLFFMLASVYLLIAFTSFFFTWTLDQDKFSGISLSEFFFNSEIRVENWLGKVGALISHVLIHRWFGLASILFAPISFLLGYRILFKHSLIPLSKTIKYSALALVWTSTTLSYVAGENYPFLGGGFGFHITEWINGLLGFIGTGFLIAFSALAFMLINFNFSFAKLKQDLSSEELPIEESDAVENTMNTSEDEMEIVAPMEEESKEEETFEVEETTALDMETVLPSDEEVFEPTPVVPKKKEKEAGLEMEVVENKEGDLPLDIEVLQPEGSSSTSTDPLEAFGEYDPTLDLSSYKFPPIDLLESYGGGKIQVNKEELEANKNKIVETLGHYNIQIDKIKAIIGPTVTLYEINPAAGVRISKIKNLEDDIALSLAALGIRIIAPIPGKGTIGIEVPNLKPEMVSMQSIISSDRFKNCDMELPIGFGKTITNDVFIADLTKMPHLLMAGATGQGKSVGLNAILVSLLYKKHPSQIKFVLVDPKKVELTLFKKIERHFLAKLPGEADAIITDTTKVVHTLNSLCIEMTQRYDLLKEAEVRNIKEYNAKFVQRKLNPNKGHRFLPYIVLVIDEFADLIMTAGKEIETPIARLAQLARAIGIHLIIATQRPSVNIITGIIKANFPARIAFRVTSKIDSRTILDSGGADQLIGRGDMLFSTGADLIRLQCAFVDTPEVEKITEFIGNQRGYSSALILPEYIDEKAESTGGEYDPSDRDVLFEEAARMVVQHQQGSASLLQRRLKLGYNRAGRIIDQLEAAGIIGSFEGSKAREVLIKDPMALEQKLSDQGSE